MEKKKMLDYIKNVLQNMPSSWLNITTHRLDIYDEKMAKTEFLSHLENLYNNNNSEASALLELPTAYDYIRLGHPLSCLLEWGIAGLNGLKPKNIISFSSKTVPVLAVLRKNLMDKVNTQILYTDSLPSVFDADLLRNIYGYKFELKKIEKSTEIAKFNGSTIFVSQLEDFHQVNLKENIDFLINIHPTLGSIIVINGTDNENYISDIQHVRRRETISMTPSNSLLALSILTGKTTGSQQKSSENINKELVLKAIKEVTGSNTKPLVASSGLSIQYAILMGLIDDASINHKGKAIKIIVPPNCYGGTNDQARRVAACVENVEIMDLPVDGGNNMVTSIDQVLNTIAFEDAVPLIIAEIPTNPRVEVPELLQLKEVLSKVRKTNTGETAIDPVFILDQTFCPNVHFLGEGEILSNVRTISFASGSKFPSGGKCTAGYCIGNTRTNDLIEKIEKHLLLCDNEATEHQYEILARQMPSMNQRIDDAYKNTREFVNYINEVLPKAKINFVSEELAKEGFTPSVFSLDLPTKGNTDQEREDYKRALNMDLINRMITQIPNESKFCVSYGQLKGCYWTVPATSTQGTTKEGDKDYIVRASLSPDLDLDLHKKVFLEFVESI
ncbi:MAG: cystathionine beta-lyase/cystathionine gamma-synthase [Lentimonas sp.]|jgi:cystathionine beta-lyase/cystathionine gamma-synthase